MGAHNYPILWYSFLIFIVYWPLSFGIYGLQYDAVDVYLPWRFYASESLLQGEVPLWNPFQDGGYPIYADHQYSIWNPELFIVSLFGRFNASTIQFLLLVYLVIAGLGFNFFLSQFKLSKKVTFVGGVMFMLSGIFVGHAQSIVSILGAVWLPWALGAYIKALKDNVTLRSGLLLVIFMFLMLSSGYQAVSIMLFYVVLTLFFARTIQLIRSRNWLLLGKVLLRHLFVVFSLGLLLTGIAISVIEVFPHLSRLEGLSLEDTQKVIFHPKSLLSILFPFSSSQSTYSGTDISMQNIFSGVFVIFLFYFGIKELRSRLSTTLIVLLVFGVFYGLASFGNLTLVQPLLAKYVPGLDQFFYPVFYRYFAWIALLTVSCFGLQQYSDKLISIRSLRIFIAAMAIVYFVTLLLNFGQLKSALNKLWADYVFYAGKLSIHESLAFESALHVALLSSFLIALYFKPRRHLLIVFIIAEISIVNQLNIPITVHNSTRTATMDQYLSTFAVGFNAPVLSESINSFEGTHRFGPFWRNIGNYTGRPEFDAWSSFHLKEKENVSDDDPGLIEELKKKPFAYLQSANGSIVMSDFQPGSFTFKVEAVDHPDIFTLQQTYYPGWNLRVDGEERDINLFHDFQMATPVRPGQHIIEFTFCNDLIKNLFYVTNFAFLFLILLAWVVFFQSYRTLRIISSFVFLIFTCSVVLTRKSSDKPLFKLIKNNETFNLSYQGRITEISFLDAEEIMLTNMDLDTDLVAEIDQINSIGKIQKENNSFRIIFKDKIGFENKEIELSAASQYYDLTNISKEVSENTSGGFVTFSFNTNQSVLDSTFLIIENKTDHRASYYRSIPFSELTNDNSNINGAEMLPFKAKNEKLAIYIWHRSTRPITISNFRLNHIEYDY